MIEYLSKRLVKVAGAFALTGLTFLTQAQTFTWAQAGPIYAAGRMRIMVVDKSDASGNTLYAGSTTSGVFKSTDGGVNWTGLVSTVSNRNVSYMAQGSDNVVYVATGEGFLRASERLKAQKGSGLYKITGNALTLVADTNQTGGIITKVACSPVNPAVIAIAGNRGVLVSTNGGTSFSSPTGLPNGAGIVGQDLKFDNTGILYCSIGNENGDAPASNALINTQIFKSADASLGSFNDKTPTLAMIPGVNSLDFGRIELAIAPSNNNIVYASCAYKFISSNRASSITKALIVSYDAGATWVLITVGAPQLDPLSNGGTVASGDRAHCITVHPTNPDILYIGSYKTYSWQRYNGSNTNPLGYWKQIGFNSVQNFQYYIHENVHDIKYVVSGGAISKYYFVTDAGIYRSVDNLTSFQPFYNGIVTGQFNNVSIERYPIGNVPAVSGSVTPYNGFIGGTGNAGLIYFSGSYPNVSQESSFIGGEINGSELSKILPGVSYAASSDGKLWLNSDVKTGSFAEKNVVKNTYNSSGALTAQDAINFSNSGYSVTGTPFKLWENYGQVAATPDSVVFYNDTLRLFASMTGVSTLTTQTTFSFTAARPGRFALIDSIVIRTGTVVLPISGGQANSPSFTGPDKKDINIKLANAYSIASTGTTAITSASLSQLGPVVSSSTSLLFNSSTLQDNISVTFSSPPFVTKTTPSLTSVPDCAAYYRVFCTVFYKYKAGDTVRVVDDRISTKTHTYTSVLTQSIAWVYDGATLSSYTMSGAVAGVSNPTFVLSSPGATYAPSGSSTFTVMPNVSTPYTITAYGNYTVSAKPVTYTISAVPSGTVTSPSYSIMPGGITQTTTVFTVTPTGTTTYTLAEFSGTVTGSTTFSTVNSSTYVITPGGTVQASPVFTINIPLTSTLTTYTIQGQSSNTLIGANTNTTTAALPVKTFTTLGSGSLPPISKKNKVIKIATDYSARLAFAGAGNRVYVSTQALSLNDPLSYVCVSASVALTCDAFGAKTNSLITVLGKPTLFQWGRNGSELYYATDANALYRVSYLHTILDSTSRNYNGKLHTNIYQFQASTTASTNPNSPYRTTLIGQFTNPITSISVAESNTLMMVTLNSSVTPVMVSGGDITTSNTSNINFTSATGDLLSGLGTTGAKVNCSLIEKSTAANRAFIGTDIGLFYCNDFKAGSPTWSKSANVGLPDAQVFDIKQQTMNPWQCYNSGQIYIATNGRGVWSTSNFLTPQIVSVKENNLTKTENNLSLFPNPTNGELFVSFNAIDGETATVNIIDITGKVVLTQYLGKLYNGQVAASIDASGLPNGIYVVNVNSSSGLKRVSKLVITK